MVATKSARYFFRDEELPAACRPVLGGLSCRSGHDWYWRVLACFRGLAAIESGQISFTYTAHAPILYFTAPAGDEDEWRQWRSVGDPVVHIELRRWADALVIAPLSGGHQMAGEVDEACVFVVAASRWHSADRPPAHLPETSYLT